MRGEDRTSGALFAYVDMEAQITGEASAAGDAATDERGPGRTRRSVFGALRPNRTAVDCAGAFAAGDASAASLYDPLGAPAGRADRVRPFVSLVRWAFPRRDHVRRLDFLKNRDRLL